jgi:cyclohexanecarboxylate-CoA ligase
MALKLGGDGVPGHRPGTRERYRAAGWWSGRTLDDEFRAAVERAHPDETAIVHASGRMSWGELDRQVAGAATWLVEHGVGRGDVVSVQLPNWPEFVVLNFAIARAGAVLNSLMPSFRQRELRHVLGRARPRVLVVPEHWGSFGYGPMATELAAEVGIPHVVRARADSGPTVDTLVATPPADLTTRRPDGDDVGFLVFTSGTEAMPKGVIYTHDILTFAVRSTIETLGVGPDDAIFMPSPLASTTGVLNGMDMMAMLPAKLVLLERWDPAAAADLIERERCAFTFVAATFLHDLTYLPGIAERDLDAFRLFACGGAPIPTKLCHDAERNLGCRVLRAYGSSESTFVVLNRPDDRSERAYLTDGRPLPAREVRIAGDDGEPAPPGTPGEILVRGPNLSVGYFDAPELNAAAFDAEGFYHSGDVGAMDEDGYLTVLGRKKEIIIRGGMNISPLEVEVALSEHPMVSEASVVGYPDERLGERACAFVVPDSERPTLDDLTGFLRERGLASYKLPERLVVVDALPRTAVGKVRKIELVRHLSEMDGSKE